MTARHCLRSSIPLAAALAVALPWAASGQGIPAGRTPLRTARKDISTLRADYADAFNRKDVAALVSMYTPDATVIQSDGTVLSGRDAIRDAFNRDTANWQRMTINSDTVRIFGSTAWDVGTVRFSRSGGREEVSHYLVVLRRGMKGWKAASVATVPEKGGMAGADTTRGADTSKRADSTAPR